jgi:NTP pyrophosphatase (non-canonical NTP hydrolase)
MGMHYYGLTKLIQKCGELIQVSAIKQAYFDVDTHPDGSSIKNRLQEQIGDVLAAIDFVVFMLNLDLRTISERHISKLETFHRWNSEITTENLLEDED